MLLSHLDTEILTLYTLDTCHRHVATHLTNTLSKISRKAGFWNSDGEFRKEKMSFGSSCNNIGNCCREEKETAKCTTKEAKDKALDHHERAKWGLPLSPEGAQVGRQALLYEFPAYGPSSIFYIF